MPTPDRRPRGHNRRAQQRRQDESQGTLLQRINAATLPLRQRLGQGMSGLGQRNKEPKAASFKLASPLPRKHTIGLLVLIPLWLLGLIQDLDRQILKRTCQQLKLWQPASGVGRFRIA
ncbi:hypothetical protein ACSZMU_20615, partial [Aeromonas caviae]